MFNHYFKSALNFFTHNKIFYAINIIGLSLGLAVFILITLYVQGEYSYDKHWDNAENIYRVNYINSFTPENEEESSGTSMMILPALLEKFINEIEIGSRSMATFGSNIVVNNETLSFETNYVDKSIISLFKFEMLTGNLESTFKDTNSIALSEESALKIFGKIDVIGEIISFSHFLQDERDDYYVTAVYRLAPGNTILRLASMVLLDEASLLIANPSNTNWDSTNTNTYLRLKPTTNIDQFNSQLVEFIDQNAIVEFDRPTPDQTTSDFLKLELQNISNIYFNGPYPYLVDIVRGNQATSNIFNAIALLVLLLACINYIILSTIKTSTRTREIAMRKVVGAKPRQLIQHFLIESFLLTLSALLFALALVELSLPFFESLSSKELELPYSQPKTYLFLSLLLLTVSILGGLYSSLTLAKLTPNSVLKIDKIQKRPNTVAEVISLRYCLMVFQFSVSIALMIATMVIYSQLSYTSKIDPGFNQKNLLTIGLGGMFRPEVQAVSKTLKQEISLLANVSSVSLSTLQPTPLYGGLDIFNYFTLLGATRNIKEEFYPVLIGYDFFTTYEIPLLAGRHFTIDRDNEETTVETDNKENYKIIISLEASKQLGFTSNEQAINKVIFSGVAGTPYYNEYSIIGVVADSQFKDLRAAAAPSVYQLSPNQAFWLTLRFQGDAQLILEQVEKVWREVVGDSTLSTNFVQDSLAQAFKQEQQQAKIFILFSSLAIFIACLGLYGSASFMVSRRIKEIALRKVMGAKVSEILRLLLWQFFKPVLIANLLSWPLVVWAMKDWLESFPYQIPFWFFLLFCLGAGFITLMITWFIVIKSATQTARKNPIHALRYE